MADESTKFDFVKAALSLGRNPLGVIALFIVLVYGIAALTLGIAGSNLESNERLPLIWFLVLFPVFVLVVFIVLVIKYPSRLYAPSDFQSDESYMKWIRLLARKGVQDVEKLRLELAAIKDAGPGPEKKADDRKVIQLEEALKARQENIEALYEFAHNRVMSSPRLIENATDKLLKRESKAVPTLVLLDIVKFSSYVKSFGPVEGGKVLSIYQLLVSKATIEFEGSEISRVGDGHILLFSSPVFAIRATLDIMSSVKLNPEMLKIGKEIRVRGAVDLAKGFSKEHLAIEKILKSVDPDSIAISGRLASHVESDFEMHKSVEGDLEFFILSNNDD